MPPSSILTVAVVWSFRRLVAAIPRHEIGPTILLLSAVAQWVTSVFSYLRGGTGD